MGRWAYLDTDEERLPEGMKRVGYDSDTRQYTFRDSEGLWVGEPGDEWGGNLTYVGPAPPEEDERYTPRPKGSAYGPLAPFFVLIGGILLLLWKYLPSDVPPPSVTCPDGEQPVRVRRGDTCWQISQDRGLELDELLKLNPKVDCDQLQAGQMLCVPVQEGSE